MAGPEKQKQSLYFSDDALREITREANRLDRSLSWIVQQAWRLAREEVKAFPAATPRPIAERASPPPASSGPNTVRAEPRPRPEPREVREVREVRERPLEGEPSAQVLDFLKGKFDRAAH
jgi:uncharacterized small protein (TIGR04563 family)